MIPIQFPRLTEILKGWLFPECSYHASWAIHGVTFQISVLVFSYVFSFSSILYPHRDTSNNLNEHSRLDSRRDLAVRGEETTAQECSGVGRAAIWITLDKNAKAEGRHTLSKSS